MEQLIYSALKDLRPDWTPSQRIAWAYKNDDALSNRLKEEIYRAIEAQFSYEKQFADGRK